MLFYHWKLKTAHSFTEVFTMMNMRRKIMNVNKDGNFDVMKMIEDVKFQNDIDAPITMKDLVAAVKNISKSVSKNDLKKYEEWTKEFASK